ncbi:alpha/beta-hydrolase [Marasmius fiardii PR-910]|nr:alpha/beta-hydrolase [Marasmius fiardii PR-910]
MPVTTVSAAVYITPVVIRTFFGHGKRKAVKLRDSVEEEEATDDIFFDEAFHIVKAFIDLGTRNTVESLQTFTNTHIPAPYWAAVSGARIPLRSCNEAADILIAWFGPEELKLVVGGERWWQVRGMDGIDAEWITEKAYLSDELPTVNIGRKVTDDEERLLRMEELDTVMLYIHGGGYFWGSINTHRYQLIRYARKFKGRVFAVNYRKAPQYPWPCPLQDVIAAYLYLIRPPKEAVHKAIPPSKIVFAGDSAGGGLCLSVLAVLRDMGAPMPAGAVLISPWVDLTHSFPSVMKNTKTDIIPEHGFLAKPSNLWPIHPVAPSNGRIGPTKSTPPPEPGHADTLRPSLSRIEVDEKHVGQEESRGVVEPQEQMLKEASRGKYKQPEETSVGHADEGEYDIDQWEPKPPKVLMDDPEAVPLELRSQIQLYATNEQLSHPLVSPILQATLGCLPPLYVIAGDGEVLRDEIIYLAHKAAYPQEYPTRRGVLRDGKRQKENMEKFSAPTKVHLQVYDGMCHVLPVFMFTPSAKHAYRSIATFVQHVTTYPNQLPDRTPFAELFSPPSQSSNDSKTEELRSGLSTVPSTSQTLHESEANTAVSSKKPCSSNGSPSPDNDLEDGLKPMMVRERVDIQGRVRRMEPRSEIVTLQIRPGEVGLIKEAPAIRWYKGQEQWDKRYKRRAEKVLRKRAVYENKTQRMIDHARQQGLTLSHEEERPPMAKFQSVASLSARVNDGVVQQERRWGPLDLEDENPPPSAIAKRRDTPEAFALLRKHIYHTAPVTHRIIPKLKISDAFRAAFDPDDDPINAPKQSVSEQQVKTHIIPIHGLKMWDVIVRYFMRETSRKAVNSVKNVNDKGASTPTTKKTEQ